MNKEHRRSILNRKDLLEDGGLREKALARRLSRVIFVNSAPGTKIDYGFLSGALAEIDSYLASLGTDRVTEVLKTLHKDRVLSRTSFVPRLVK